MGLQALQQHIRDGRVTSKHPKAPSCPLPKYASCILAKMTTRHDGTTRSHKLKETEGGLKKDDLFPGSCVSVDHYGCRLPGRLPHTAGKEQQNQQYSGGAMFCDHSSGKVSVRHQVMLNGSDTIRSKRSFKRERAQDGVTIDSYHSDNGIFKANDSVEELQDRNPQRIDYSGVGAHHQNSVAEGAIHIISNRARTLMVHATIHWPEESDPGLWLFAMDYSAHLYNNTPNRTSKLSPNELFARCTQPVSTLDHSRVWGCPAYREPVPFHRELVPLHREPVFQEERKSLRLHFQKKTRTMTVSTIVIVMATTILRRLLRPHELNVVTVASIRSSTATNGSTWRFTQLETRSDPDQS